MNPMPLKQGDLALIEEAPATADCILQLRRADLKELHVNVCPFFETDASVVSNVCRCSKLYHPFCRPKQCSRSLAGESTKGALAEALRQCGTRMQAQLERHNQGTDGMPRVLQLGHRWPPDSFATLALP